MRPGRVPGPTPLALLAFHIHRPCLIPPCAGALLARGRVVLAGAIIAAIGLFAVLIGLGLQDERDPELHEKRVGAVSGETRGGRFVDPANDKANVVAYNNPMAEE